MTNDTKNGDMERWEILLKERQASNDWTNIDEFSRELQGAYWKVLRRTRILNGDFNKLSSLHANSLGHGDLSDSISRKLEAVGLELLAAHEKRMEITDILENRCNFKIKIVE